MAKQLNVSLVLNADTKQAKAAFEDLQKTLLKIQGTAVTSSKNMFNVDQIKEATNAARELASYLNKATDANTGKLNLSTFSNSLKTSGKTLEQYKASLESLGNEGSMAFAKVAKSIATADNPLRRTNALLQEFRTTLVNTARWQISSSIIHGFMGAIQSAYGYAQDLNESLNNIRIVTGQSVDQMARFADQANRAAKELSTTTTAYTDAALIYYQQGLGDKAVQERTNVTIKMANVSRQAAEEVSNQMTAIWNNFTKAGDNLEYYADVITALGAATASSSEEISTGLEKFAAIANTVGLSYEYATSALATITATTRQSADVVGTALKTLFARIQDLDLGKTLEDGVDLGKYSQALKTIGVDILDATGHVREMDAILDDMGEKWKTLSQEQKIATAETVAGQRQYAQLMALMDNWDFMQQNLQTARGSEGTLQKQADIYAESWEAAGKRVKASLQTIYQALLDDKFFISMTNGFAKLLDGVNGFIKGMGGLKGILSTIAAFITQSLAKEAPAALTRITEYVRQLTGQAQQAGSTLQQDVQKWAGREALSAKNEFEAGTAGSAEYMVEMNVIEMLAQRKREYNQYEAQYSQEEKASAQETLATIEAQGNALQAKAKQYDQVNKRIDEMAQNLSKLSRNQTQSTADLEQLKDIGKSNGAFEALKKNISQLNQLKKEDKITSDQYNDSLLKIANSAKKMEDGLGYSTESLDISIQKFQAGDMSVEKFSETLSTELSAAFNSTNDDIQLFIEYLSEVSGIPVNSLQRFVSTLQQSGKTMAELPTNIDLLGKSFDHLQQHTSKTSEQIMMVSSSIMQMSSLFSSIQRLGDAFDEDSTALERFGAVVGVITTLIFALNAAKKMTTTILQAEEGSLFSGVAAWLGHTAATKADTAATVTDTAAKGAATVANNTLNVSLGTTLLMVGLVAAAIAALTLIIWGIVAAFRELKASSPEAQLERMKEGAENLKTEAEEARQAADDLRSSFDKYDSAVKKLEECREGTEEWKKALQDVNDIVLEILSNHPELIGQLSISRGKNGEMIIGNAEEIMAQANQRATNAQIGSIGANAVVSSRSYTVRADKEYDSYVTKVAGEKGQLALYGALHNADQYLNATDEKFAALQEELGMSDEAFSSLRLTLMDLGKEAQNVATGLHNATQLILQEKTGEQLASQFNNTDIADAIIKMTSDNADAALERLTGKYIATESSSNAQWNGKDRSGLIDKYIQYKGLTGEYWADNNAVRNTDNGRVLAITNGSEVKEIPVEQMASFVAAMELATQLEEDEQDAINFFNGLSSGGQNLASSIALNGDAKNGLGNFTRAQLQKTFSTPGDLSALGISESDLKSMAEKFGYDSISQLYVALDSQIGEVVRNYDQYYQSSLSPNWTSEYAEADKIASKLKYGDTIKPEDWNKLTEESKKYFTQMADGTYQLIGDAETFYNTFQSDKRQELINELNRKKDFGVRDTSADERQILGMATSWSDIDETQLQVGEEDISKWDGYLETINRIADSSVLAATSLYEFDAALAQARDHNFEVDLATQSTALISIAEGYDNATQELERYKDALLNADEAQIKETTDTLRASITIGEAAKAHKLDAEALEIQAQQIRAANKDMELSAEMAAKMAIANQRMNKGVETLNKNFADWKKTLAAADKTSADYAQTASEVYDAMRDLMNLSDDFEIPADFLESAKNLELLEQAANGSQKAINLLGLELADATVQSLTFNEAIASQFNLGTEAFQTAQTEIQNGIDAIRNNIDSLMDGTLTLEQVMGGSAQSWVNSLNTMAQATGMSVQDMNNFLSQLGVQAEVNINTVREEMQVPTYDEYSEVIHDPPEYEDFGDGGRLLLSPGGWHRHTYTVPGPPKTVMGYKQIANVGTVGNIKPVKVTYTGVGGGIKAGGVSPSSTSSKSSGGGGGGSSANHETKETKNINDELERYHWLNEELDDLNRDYDKLSKAKDRAFGKNRINLINQEIAALDKLIAHNQQYIKSIQSNRASDLNALMNGGITKTYTSADEAGTQRQYMVQGLYDYGFGADSFDEHGNLVNYDSIVSAAVARYNAAVEYYNSLSASEQTAAAKDMLHEAELQYESLMELIQQYEETNNLYQDKLEEILESFRQQQDLRLEALEYELELKISFSDADLKRLDYERKMLKDDIFKAAEYLRTIWNSGGSESNWSILQTRASDVMAHAEQVLNTSHGDIVIDGDGNVISNPDLSDEGWVEALRNVEDEIYNTIDSLWELDDTMCHYYEETLQDGEKRLDALMSKLEDCTKVLQHFQKISELLGKEKDYEWMGEILAGQVETIRNELDAAKTEYAYAQQQYENMMQRYNETKNMVDEGTRQKMEDELQAQYESMVKWQDKMYEKTEEYAEASIALYENMVKQQTKIMEDAMTGGMGFDSMLDSMKNVSSTQDMILTKTNQIYETNKLMRQIQQEMDKTNNSAAKARLQSFNLEIEDLQKRNTMSKFDLEVANARYKLLLAQIALEEAQNAKSTVRLQRDNQGNYGYVYTADQDKVENAQQVADDAANDLYNLSLEKANENAQALIELDKELHDELERIAIEYRGNDEKIQEEQARVRAEYAEKRKAIEEDYLTALYWLNETATTDISEAWSTRYQDMILDTEEWQGVVDDCVSAVDEIYNQWKEDMDENVTPSVGENLDELKGKINDVLKESQTYEQWFNQFAADNARRLDEVSKLTNEYYKQRDAVMALIQSLMDYCAAIDAAIRAAAEMESAQQQAQQSLNVPTQSPATPYTQNYDTTPSDNGNPPGSPPPSGQTTNNTSYQPEWFLTNTEYKSNGDGYSHTIIYTYAAPAGGTKTETSTGQCTFNDQDICLLCGQKKKQGCFTGDTLITMDDLTDKQIQDIKIGDLVLSYNVDRNYFEPKRVLDIYIQHKMVEIVNIYLSNGVILNTTTSHPLLTSEGWKSLDISAAKFSHGIDTTLLQINDKILGFENNGIILDIKFSYHYEGIPVYTLKIEDCHTFLANGMIVHNSMQAMAKFASGGYTGEWVGGSNIDNGKLAFLHQKELVLNQEDTENVLNTVKLVRMLTQGIDLRAAAGNYGPGLGSPSFSGGSSAFEQQVTIHAEFPNASDHNEIEQAFDDLMNRAAQFVGRPTVMPKRFETI